MRGRAAPGGLGDRTVAASGWRFGTVAAQLALQLVVLAVLSRLLPPEDFGVLGIAMIFVNLGTVVSDLGAGSALIQRRDVTSRHVRTTLSLSLGIGLVLALALALGAPLWAALFRVPRVEPILRLLSVSFLLNACALVPNSLLWREMRMRALGVAEISGYALGFGAVGITLAVQGFGIWSLAWAAVVQSSVRAVLLFALARQAPLPGLGRRELQDVLGFGFGVSLTQLFNFAATKGDYVVVGRWLGSEALGLYERAYRLMEMPATYFAGVLARVLFPALSEIQEDQGRMRRAFRAAITAVVLVYAPAAAALWITAPHLVVALFGEAWTGAVAPLQLLALGLLFRGAHKICDALIRARGAVYRSAWRVLVYALAVIGGSALGLRWGIEGVAAGVTAAIGFRYLLVGQLALRLLGLGWRPFLRWHGPGLLVAAGSGAILVVLEGVATAAGLGPWPVLLILASASGLGLAVGAAALPMAWVGPDLHRLGIRALARVPRAGSWLARRAGGGHNGAGGEA